MKKHGGWFWVVPLFFAVAVLGFIRLVSDTPMGYKFWERPVVANLIDLISTIVLSYIFQVIMYYTLKRSNKSTVRLTLKSLLLEYLIILLMGVVIVLPSVKIIHNLENCSTDIGDLVIAAVISSLLLIIVYSIYRGDQILSAYVDQKLQTERVKNIQTETELKFLKAQFHPHFLFNALNTIYFQIDETNETPRKTIEHLSDLLRYQLYDVNQLVTLEQELNFILTYINLQKVRMKETLRLEISFDPLLKEQKIHSLLLFPLIENAFKYVGGEYWIKIEARMEKNKLLFEVLNAIPQTPLIHPKEGGIGMENLRRRLELLYPEKHKLTVSKQTGFYAVNLMIGL